jgi:hypothetical protein
MIINSPRQGISSSPHVGFADIRNLDISSISGIVRLNNILEKKSSTTVTGQVNWLVRHPITTSEVYALDNGGVVYKSTDSGASWAILTGSSSTNAHGNGLWIWKNYLFVARDALLDVCGDGTATGITSSNWTLGWKSIDSDVLWHPMLTSKNDNKLYGGAGRYVYSLDENTGQTFAPGTSATFTWTQQDLDLPPSYRIKCLEELGNSLMLGTWQGTNVYDIRIADIFPWDRSSVSFGQPISVDDFGVHAMKNNGNSLTVLAGISGTVRKCDGINTLIIGQIPTDLSGGKYIEFYPGSLCNYKNKIFFGTGNPGTTALGGQGIYSLQQTGQGNILNLEHLNSSLTDGSAASVKISALLPISIDTLLSAFRSNTTYGIDLTTATSYAYGTNYSGYFETPLYYVGVPTSPKAFKPASVQFAKTLATGEGVQIKWRKNLSDSWSDATTIDYTTYGGILSKNFSLPIGDCEFVQFKIALLGTSTTTPQFKSLTL